jgi:uncharacterized protein YecT (DUF1311 family)
MRKLTLMLAGAAALTLSAATAIAQPDARRGAPNTNDDDRYYSVCERGSQSARLACARDELASADRRLNVVYQRMLADATRADRGERGRRYTRWYAQTDALRNAERAWIAMRDSDCRFVTQPDIGRRRQVELTYTLCQADRTAERVDQLENMRDQLRNSYDS